MLLAYTAIGLMAVAPIYGGSFATLRRPATAPKAEGDDIEDEDSVLAEPLSSSDALIFPVLGGCVLGGFYLVMTYLSKDWLNTILAVYFFFVGIASNTQASYRVAVFLMPRLLELPKYDFKINFGARKEEHEKGKEHKSEDLSLRLSVLYGVLGIASLLLSIYYYKNKNWIASNVFGLAFSFNGIQLIALDSFRTGMILLAGLFFYDIYFVFGTEIMVTVAKGLEAPIKIVFPKDVTHHPFGPATMLGLGDIVVPGVYVALALRFDLSEHHRRHPSAKYRKNWFGFHKPYFTAAMIAYVLGLATTILVMHSFQAAQPALLYLSPACILSTILTAWRREELGLIWQFRDDAKRDAAAGSTKSA